MFSVCNNIAMERKKTGVNDRIVTARIKARLYVAGVTQRDIARAAGVTPALVSLVVSGRRKNENIMSLIAEMTRDVDV